MVNPKLTLVVGPMGSGKTSYLISQLEGKAADVYQPTENTRDGDMLRSHDGQYRPAYVTDSRTLASYGSGVMYCQPIVVIDEAHLWEQHHLISAVLGFIGRAEVAKVYVAGLENVGEWYRLLHYRAHQIVRFQRNCEKCFHSPGTKHISLTGKRIGGLQDWQLLCERCVAHMNDIPKEQA